MHFNPCAPYGARRIDVAGPILGTEISIHAPLTGRDLSLHPNRRIRTTHFNPRAPYGARHSPCPTWAQNNLFQSTRPLRGATKPSSEVGKTQSISIHAPLTGRDASRSEHRSASWYFNPRAPYGARHGTTPHLGQRVKFQSTRPLRGATRGSDTPLTAPMRFQSTRPLRGATV